MLEKTDVAIIGAGPGGYTAALRLGQLGKQVMLIDANALGGVCLNQGCIPSKALIHAAEFAFNTKHGKAMGIEAEKVRVNVEKLMAWKRSGIEKLEKGLETLCKKRSVEIVKGFASFEGNNRLRVEAEHEVREIEFKQVIIDVGSVPVSIPGIEIDEKTVISSEHALELNHIPKEMVVLGAGYIGIELGTVFAKLGCHVSIIQRSERILSQMDEEAALLVQKRLDELGIHVFLNSSVQKLSVKKGKAVLDLQTPEKRLELHAEKVLVALGRKPHTERLGLENTKVQLDEHGYIRVNPQCQTADPNIFAVGDITGPPLLAHRAFRMGKVAAEAIAGLPSAFDNVAMPAVIFADPEIATVGLSESEAKAKGFELLVGKFPFRNLGRAVSINKETGFVKIVADKKTEVILGIQIIGENASDLIGEAALAVELGAQLEDVAATIHPHPTFCEALMEAAEDALGKSVNK